jgi:hypothetical protein
MIIKYICDYAIFIRIYYKVQTYCKNHSNDYQTWWNIYNFIKYKLIAPFQFHMKSSNYTISQKIYGWSFSFKQVKVCE